MSGSSTDSAGAAPALPPRLRLRRGEAKVLDEIAAATPAASGALEVYRLALSRVAPLAEADFGSVFLRDPADPAFLKLVCAHNWPQASAKYLSQLRIRVGSGPTGQAVAGGATVEAPNIFEDTVLRDWWEPARELGIASLISVPLRSRGEPVGAVTFYYVQPRKLEASTRHLMELVADRLGVVAETG
jgi:GAF domain-containing protein